MADQAIIWIGKQKPVRKKKKTLIKVYIDTILKGNNEAKKKKIRVDSLILLLFITDWSAILCHKCTTRASKSGLNEAINDLFIKETYSHISNIWCATNSS